MNLNPIGQKLAKMFGKKRKQHFSTSTIQGTFFNSPEVSQLSFYDNDQLTYLKKNQQIKSLKKLLEEEKDTTSKLSQKLRDHELLQEFYLKELSNRKDIQEELQKKLNILGEEIGSILTSGRKMTIDLSNSSGLKKLVRVSSFV